MTGGTPKNRKPPCLCVCVRVCACQNSPKNQWLVMILTQSRWDPLEPPTNSGLVGDPPEIVAPGQDLKTATRPGKHTKNHGKSPFFMGKLWKTHYKLSFSLAMLVYQRVEL